MKTLLLSLSFALTLLAASVSSQNADVLMQHNDPARTGANLREVKLTPASVKEKFGKLFEFAVDGQIYAQPLIVSDIDMPNRGTRNVVLVSTMKNNVYAFDADHFEDCPLWKVNLGKPVPYKMIPFNWGSAIGFYNIQPFIGIASTPVIDSGSGRMWVAVKSMKSAEELDYHLHCIDLKTGAVLATSKSIVAGEGRDKLQAQTALQRTGLLLEKGTIYLSFGSQQDGGYYHGWVVAFDASTLKQIHEFCVTPNNEDGEGGIWQAGNGLAADDDGNIYFMTGNGLFKKNEQYGSSFVKLDSNLKVVDSFTPANYEELTRDDIDLGSSGPLLLPDSNQLVGGGKEGRFYLLDRDHLGGLQPECSGPPVLQEFRVSDHWSLTWLSWLIPVFGYHHIHGGPVYWKSRDKGPLIYVWPESTKLKAYSYDPVTHFRKKPSAVGPKAPPGMPGGSLSISANGDRDGLLWATTPLKDDGFVKVVRGVLRVFDANSLEELWSSDKATPEDLFNFAKYCSPTIANGNVYLPTFSDKLNVYGLLPEPECLPTWTKTGKPVRNSKGHGHMRM